MRTPPKAKQYTIRAVPAEVDLALRQKAKREGRSLNDVAVEALAKGSGVGSGEVVHRDLDHLIGTWREDPKFDEAIAEQRRIDPELWR